MDASWPHAFFWTRLTLEILTRNRKSDKTLWSAAPLGVCVRVYVPVPVCVGGRELLARAVFLKL